MNFNTYGAEVLTVAIDFWHDHLDPELPRARFFRVSGLCHASADSVA
jgi:hypothetical protein